MAGTPFPWVVVAPDSIHRRYCGSCRVGGEVEVELRPLRPNAVHYPVRLLPPIILRCSSLSHPYPRTSILVLAPTPLVAALFIGFGRIVTRTGSQYSRLKPTLCMLALAYRPLYPSLPDSQTPRSS